MNAVEFHLALLRELPPGRRRERVRCRIRVLRLNARGLTAQGTPLVRPRRTDLSSLQGRCRRRARWMAYRRQRAARGLNTHGRPRIYRVWDLKLEGRARKNHQRRILRRARNATAPSARELAYAEFRLASPLPTT